MRYVTALVISGGVFGLMDALWLRNAMDRLYKPDMGALMADNVRWGPALLFYGLYLIGMLYFAITPALSANRPQLALINGAMFGLMCYMTYDLTNHAVMAQWSVRLTIIDIAWGTFATAVAAYIATKATSVMFPLH